MKLPTVVLLCLPFALYAENNPLKISGPSLYQEEITALADGFASETYLVGWYDDYSGPFLDWAGEHCFVSRINENGQQVMAPVSVPTAGSMSVTHRCYGAVTDPDGGVIVTGIGMDEYAASTVGLVARFSENGVLLWHKSFSIAGYPYLGLKDVEVFGSNVFVAGTATFGGTYESDAVVLRLDLATGEPDPSFGLGGAFVFDLPAGGMTASNSGGLLVIDGFGNITFGGTTKGWGAVESRAYLVRLNTSGTLDASFGSGGVEELDFNERVQLVDLDLSSWGGVFVHVKDNPLFYTPTLPDRFMMVTSSGERYWSFGFGGIASLAPLPDSSVTCKLVDDHSFTCAGRRIDPSPWSLVAWRGIDDGRILDASFGVLDYGLNSHLTTANDILINTDGSIITGGGYEAPQLTGLLVRVQADGSIAPSFYR